MKTKLICIGGIPGVGKTTLSYALANKIKVDKVISIDLIKAIIKTFNLSDNNYILSTSHEAYKIENLSHIEGYYKYADILNEQVIKILNNLTNEKIIIIEGVSINDSFITKIDLNKFDCFYINIMTNHNELKKRYKNKNKIRKSNWLDNINIIFEIDNELKKNKNGINIENNNLNNCLDEMERLIYENICL